MLAFVGRFPEPSRLGSAMRRARPASSWLGCCPARVACQVLASRIPRAAGDKARDRPARPPTAGRLHRAGELVAICIPAAGKQAVRELCRARADLDR